jgi:hypothetical protein
VLTQFNARQLEPLVGPALARAFYVAVRFGFLLSVITIAPSQMAPYRESLSRLLAGRELSGAPYYLLTYASLGDRSPPPLRLPCSCRTAASGLCAGPAPSRLAWTPLRRGVSEQLAPPPFLPSPPPTHSAALFFSVAMVSGSIWVPIQFVGATAGALIAFIFPALVALKAAPADGRPMVGWAGRGRGCACCVLPAAAS